VVICHLPTEGIILTVEVGEVTEPRNYHSYGTVGGVSIVFMAFSVQMLKFVCLLVCLFGGFRVNQVLELLAPRVFRIGKIVWDTGVLKGAPPEPAPLSSLLSTPTSADGAQQYPEGIE
jgi:hypothetical protein